MDTEPEQSIDHFGKLRAIPSSSSDDLAQIARNSLQEK